MRRHRHDNFDGMPSFIDSWDEPDASPSDWPGDDKNRRAHITFGRLGILAAVFIIGGLAAIIMHPPAGLEDWLADLMKNPETDLQRQLEDDLQQNQPQKALKTLDQLISLNPNNPGYHEIKGHILAELKKPREAIGCYTQVLALPIPRHRRPLVLNNLAYMRALAEVDLEQGLREVNAALRQDPHNMMYLDTRAYLLYLLGRVNEAHQVFEKQINRSLQPFERDAARGLLAPDPEGHGEVAFHRGLVHRELGDEKKAKKDFLLAQGLGFKIVNYPRPVPKRNGP